MKSNQESILLAEEMIEFFVNKIASKKRALELGRNVLEACSWIVVIGRLPVDPEIIDMKSTGKVEHGKAEEVRRFSEEDARMLAETAVNGAGTKGRAIPWRRFLEEEIVHLEEMLEMWNERTKEVA